MESNIFSGLIVELRFRFASFRYSTAKILKAMSLLTYIY